jgi:hypothetical protein
MDRERVPAKMARPAMSGPVNDQHIKASFMQRPAGAAMFLTEFGETRTHDDQTIVCRTFSGGV